MYETSNKVEGASDRIVSGLFLSVPVLLTVMVIPIIIGTISRSALKLLDLLHTWVNPYAALALLLVTFSLGYIMGSTKTLTTLGHMWLTEKPISILKSLAIWFFIGCFYMVSYELRHRL